MIITVSGTAASGKSEVAERLARETGMDYFSINKGFVRELALRKGMGVRKFYERHADNIDSHLDGWQRDVCRFMDGFVLESKIGFHWAKSAGARSFNVFVKCGKDAAADRLAKNGSGGLKREDLVKKLSEEESFESGNYRRKYGIDDFQHPAHFDLVLDTTGMDLGSIHRTLIGRIRPLLDREHEMFLGMVKRFPALSDGRKGVYISTPHTTGKAYYEKLKTSGTQSLQSADGVLRIIKENEKRTAEFFRKASSMYGDSVINPVSAADALDNVKGVRQSEVMSLWRKFIRRYASKMLMNEGWEYSNGCVEELYLALKEGVKVFNHGFNPMDRDEGLKRIESAISDIKNMGFGCEKLEFFRGEIGRDVYALLEKGS